MSLPPEIRSTVKAFVFDAYGTLFDTSSPVTRHAAAIGPDAAAFAAMWRAKQLEYTWTHSLMGIWIHFWMLTQASLDHTFARFPRVDRHLRQALLDGWRNLDVFPDSAPCLDRLGQAGFGRAILSNGERDMLADVIRAAGLASRFELVLSVDEVSIFKPAPAVYELARARIGLQPHEIAFVSSNRWDVAGAAAFGFVPIWVNRTGQPSEYPGLEAVATVSDLSEVG